jgi:hypothetical protein
MNLVDNPKNPVNFELGNAPICKIFNLARNTVSPSLQTFRCIRYTSSMSVPYIHCISDFLSKP